MSVYKKLCIVESRCETAIKVSQAEKDSLQKQLTEKELDAERYRRVVSLDEIEDSLVSFLRELLRSKR